VAPGHPFILPPNPGAIPAFPANATAAIIAATERNHREALRQWYEYNNLHSALKTKLMASVQPSFLQSIRHRRNGFATITLREMFLHLFTTYAHLDGIQVHANRLRLNDPWDPSSRIEDLISHLEDVQELAADATRPIPNADIVDAAFSKVFNSSLYDDECRTWEARPAVELTWPNFKTHFLAAQTTLNRRRARTASNAGYTANSATQELEDLVGRLVVNNDNYIATSRQDYAAFAANTQQHSTDEFSKVSQQLQELKTEMAALKAARPPPRSDNPRRSRATSDRRERRPYIPNDNYCWSHGFGIGATHTSETCNTPKQGHKRDATKDNMRGGSTYGRRN
jgi:hypothetical protein